MRATDSVTEIDEFVDAMASKYLSTRGIDLFAGAHFQEMKAFFHNRLSGSQIAQ
jgi:hypothetical protein